MLLFFKKSGTEPNWELSQIGKLCDQLIIHLTRCLRTLRARLPRSFSSTSGARCVVGALSAKMEINHYPLKHICPKGLTQNNHRFQCSLTQIKNRYPLSGLFRKKTVKFLNGWISCLALTDHPGTPTSASEGLRSLVRKTY